MFAIVSVVLVGSVIKFSMSNLHKILSSLFGLSLDFISWLKSPMIITSRFLSVAVSKHVSKDSQ